MKCACVLEKDLAFQKTFDTSKSILETGPVLFSSDESTEWPIGPCHLTAFKKGFKQAPSITAQSGKQKAL